MADDSNPYLALLRDVVEALEKAASEQRSLSGALARLETSNTQAHKDLRDELRRATESMSNVTTLWSAEQNAEERNTKARTKAISAVWSNQSVQFLLAGIVLAILQVVGVGWFAHSYLPTTPTPPAVIQEHGP